MTAQHSILRNIVDLERYPIDQMESPALQKIISAGRLKLGQDGALALPGFILPEAVAQILRTANKNKQSGHSMSAMLTPYSDKLSEGDDSTLPPDHPRRIRLPASHRFIPGDLVADEIAIKQIYRNPLFISLLKNILQVPDLHPIADPLGCINLLIYEPGDTNGWHFDSTDFVISLMLQPASRGGDYQYIPGLRSIDDENLKGVATRMKHPDDPEGVSSIHLEPGTLFLFKGKNTFHRVTEIEGCIERVVGILSYHQEPNHVLSDSSKLKMYGRVN
jgi:hypothetical protein